MANSFYGCGELSHVGFAFDSQLRFIAHDAFWSCREIKSMSLPSHLESLGNGALHWPSLEYLGIDSTNRHFSISGDHLLVCDGTAIVGHIGRPTELCIGNAIEELFDGCFCDQKYLSAVSFEPGSRLRRIGDSAFHMSALLSIDIPASVKRLENLCLADCRRLAIVRFEADSQLSLVAGNAFRSCSSLKTVRVPAHLKDIIGAAFRGSGVQIVVV
jgi:hypothetical protein